MSQSIMTSQKTIYIKIGGSTITEKSSGRPKPRMETIKDFCKEVKEVVSSGTSLILAHGGGSYAHPFAAKHGLNKGLNPEDRIGVTETRFWLTELSQIFLREFLELELPVIVFHPSSLIYKSSKGWKLCFSPIKLALRDGITPLLMGDIVFDEEKGVSIISADDIPFLLLDVVDEILFLIDVPGVLDKKGNPIPRLHREDLGRLDEVLNLTTDVTGGIKEKIRKALILAEKGKKVRISGYRRKGDLLMALNGISGTEIMAK